MPGVVGQSCESSAGVLGAGGGGDTVSHRTPLVCFVAAVPEQYSHLCDIRIVLGVTVNLDFEVHHRMWAG